MLEPGRPSDHTEFRRSDEAHPSVLLMSIVYYVLAIMSVSLHTPVHIRIWEFQQKRGKRGITLA